MPRVVRNIRGGGSGEREERLIEIKDSKCGELDRQRHLSGHKSMENCRGHLTNHFTIFAPRNLISSQNLH